MSGHLVTLAVRAAALMTLICALGVGAVAPQAPVATTRRDGLSARVLIHVRDAKRLNASGISLGDLDDALARFTASRAKYKLSELSALEMTGVGGGKVTLGDVADVDVELEPVAAVTRPAGP